MSCITRFSFGRSKYKGKMSKAISEYWRKLAAEGIPDFTLFPTLKTCIFLAWKRNLKSGFILLKKISLCY